MNNPDIDSLLDDLLKGSISAEVLKKELEDDPLINPDTEIEAHFAAAKAIRRYAVVSKVQSFHRSFLDELSTSSPVQPESPVRKMDLLKWTMRVAAVFFIVIGGWLAFEYNQNSSTGIYKEIYQPYNLNTDRGIGDISAHNMVQDFKELKFDKVIEAFEELEKSNQREKFLAGYSYLETGNFGKAIIQFNEILADNKEQGQRLYNDEAEYYLGLSYLKLHDISKAIDILEKIQSNPDHTFHEKVTKWTLRKLKWLN